MSYDYDTIQIGDVFEGRPLASFATIEVIGIDHLSRYRCKCTRRDGSTVINHVYATTLRSGQRYVRKVQARDFNVGVEPAYARPGGIDVPTVPTAPAREASAYSFLTSQTATLIFVEGSTVKQAKSKAAKTDLLLNAPSSGGVMLLLVPGKYSMDSFYIDSRTKALETLGLKAATPAKVQTAADGSLWVAA